MNLIENSDILPVLKGYNPWWENGVVPNSLNKEIKRAAYYDSLRFLQHATLTRALVLSGPRRVGKTTILYQLAQYYLDQGFDPKDILYFSIEHPILKLASIEAIITLYTENIATTHRKKIILIDEIQYADEPRIWLKVFVDLHPEWKIITTGSASITFNAKDMESGVGRWITIPVHTLSFFEYVLLRAKCVQDISLPSAPLLNILPLRLEKIQQHTIQQISIALQPLRNVFVDFLLNGGFPETTLIQDLNLSQRLLREDIVDKVLKRDMAAFYGIRKIVELEKLFLYLCMHVGLIIHQKTVSSALAISEPQVNKLLEALKAAHLIQELPGYQQGGKKALKGKSKWYVVDASMRNAVLIMDRHSLITNTHDAGLVVEAATINELASYKYEKLPRMGYWRSKNKKKEVDIIVDAPSAALVGVEVKYRETVLPEDVGGLIDFAGTYDRPVVCGVITKADKDFGHKKFIYKNKKEIIISFVPAHIFLFLLGRYQYNKNR